MVTLRDPNIIIIVIDAGRRDYFSCYGYSQKTTPNVDNFASCGVLFENVISTAPWTIPSHGSMFTGLYPFQHKATWQTLRLQEGIPTIFDIFTKRGYDAVAVAANSLIVSPYSMFGPKTKVLGPPVCNDPDVSSFAGDFDYQKTSSSSIARYFIDYLEKTRLDKPQIMYLNFYDLHAKYKAREPFYSQYVNRENDRTLKRLGDFYSIHFQEMNDEITVSEEMISALRASYAARLAMIDFDLGSVFLKLKERGILDNCVLLITSDHGDVLGDHKKPSFHHQFSIYNSLLRIPLIFFSNAIKTPVRIAVPLLQNIDILPTILEICGANEPALSENSPGISLAQYFCNAGRADAPRKYAVSTYESPLRFIMRNRKKVNSGYIKDLSAIQDTSHKLIFSDSGLTELYDIKEDDSEKVNIAGEFPKKVEELKNAFYKIKEKYKAPAPEESNPRTDSADEKLMIQRLKALGYIE